MGKAITFAAFMWLIVSLVGGVIQGSTISVATTALTSDINDTDTVIDVISTVGFPKSGFINILDERIGYSSITDTQFRGTVAIKPVLRGTQGTEAVAHVAGERVRTVESAMLNQSVGYNLAVMSDASGAVAFVTIPYSFVALLISFFVLPLGFLGTDLAILTYLWGVVSVGLIVGLGIQLIGGRRV